MRKLTLEELDSSRPKLEEIQTNPFPVYVVVDNMRSLWNVGSIFRTSDGARISKIYLCGITGKPYRKEIEKTSLGAEYFVPWEYIKNSEEIVKKLKSEGVFIVLLEQTDKSIDLRKAEIKFPVCLVIGHERNGVSDEILKYADMSVEIPMFGVKHNLNVAVAYGIAVYELIKKYQDSKIQKFQD
jgi:tRNA G18 (ribose-2'-O)-methylase SpoU